MGKNDNNKIRYNIVTIFIYIVGIILILQLFNLQIVHGQEYRETSNTRLTRESTIEAARGAILDRTGTTLVSSNMTFSLEIYKTKIDDDNLNVAILNIIQVLEKYNISYPDSLPITINPYNFKVSGETLTNWKKNNNIPEEATAEEAWNYLYLYHPRPGRGH